MINRTIDNAAFNVFGFIVPSALSLIALPYIVSKLGVEAYGIYALVASVVGYLSFIDLGLNSASVKYIAESSAARDYEKVNRVVGSTLSVYFFIGCLGLVGVWSLTDWLVFNVFKVSPTLVEPARIAFWLGSVSLMTNIGAGTFSAILEGLQRYDVSNWISVVFTTLDTLLKVGVLFLGGSLVAVMVVTLITSALTIPVYIAVAKRLLPSLRIRPYWDPSFLKELVDFGGMVLIQRIASRLLFRLDRVLVGAILGPAAVTYYVVPANVLSRVHSVISRLTAVLFPLTSSLNTNERQSQLYKLYVRATGYITVLAAALYLPLFLFSFPILKFWMGEDFANHGAPILALLSISYFLLSFNTIPNNFLLGLNKPGIVAASAVAGALIQLGVALLLLPRLGVVGMPLAQLSSMIRLPVYIIYVHVAVIGVSNLEILRRSYLKPCLAGAAVAVTGLMYRGWIVSMWDLFAAFVFSTLLFGVIAFLLGVFDSKDKAMILGYLRHLITSVSHVRGVKSGG